MIEDCCINYAYLEENGKKKKKKKDVFVPELEWIYIVLAHRNTNLQVSHLKHNIRMCT